MTRILPAVAMATAIAVSMISANSATAGPAAALEQTCARLGDVLRLAVDRATAGDPSVRVQIALEAHKRLECPVNDLLDALHLEPVDESALRRRAPGNQTTSE